MFWEIEFWDSSKKVFIVKVSTGTEIYIQWGTWMIVVSFKFEILIFLIFLEG